MLADGLLFRASEAPPPACGALSVAEEARVEAVIAELQAAMWNCAGLLRQESTLRDGLAVQEACAAGLADFANQGKGSRRFAEAQALTRVAGAILRSALARTESRGAHFRNDYPQRDDDRFRKHSVLYEDGQVLFEEW
jgi:succinate dehydrogenase/fumarate reductase flavoprotein subunit